MWRWLLNSHLWTLRYIWTRLWLLVLQVQPNLHAQVQVHPLLFHLALCSCSEQIYPDTYFTFQFRLLSFTSNFLPLWHFPGLVHHHSHSDPELHAMFECHSSHYTHQHHLWLCSGKTVCHIRECQMSYHFCEWVCCDLLRRWLSLLGRLLPWLRKFPVKMMGCTTPPSASCPPLGLRCLSGVPWQCLFSPRCCWSSLRQPTRLCGLRFASKCLNFAMSVTMCFVAPEATVRPFSFTPLTGASFTMNANVWSSSSTACFTSSRCLRLQFASLFVELLQKLHHFLWLWYTPGLCDLSGHSYNK